MPKPDVRKELEDVASAASAKPADPDARLKWTVLGILLLMACALGLKTWQERQNDDYAQLALLFADASAIAGRMEGRADTQDYGVYYADTAEEAKKIVIDFDKLDTDTASWIRSCITAKRLI